jgi:isopentenyldiphosphate isomerase
MNIKELKKELGLTNKQLSEFFGYKNSLSYRNSTAKPRIESGLCSFYAFAKSKREGKTKETDLTDAVD